MLIKDFQKENIFAYTSDSNFNISRLTSLANQPSFPYTIENKSSDPEYIKINFIETFDTNTNITTVQVNPSAMKDLAIKYAEFVSVLNVNADPSIVVLTDNSPKNVASPQSPDTLWFKFSTFFQNKEAKWTVDRDKKTLTQRPQNPFSGYTF